jgi:hypothetical protein
VLLATSLLATSLLATSMRLIGQSARGGPEARCQYRGQHQHGRT